MSANSFGHIFKIHTFGESHGVAMGVIIEGCPSQLPFSLDILKKELKRRRPGQWPWTSSRKEEDEPQVLSGVYQGKTLGTPIAIVVFNQDARSQDYDQLKKNFRAGHADDLWKNKFNHFDHRGGGRASGRETLSRVLGGAVAKMLLQKLCPDLKMMGFVRQIGNISLNPDELNEAELLFQKNLLSEEYPACFPHKEKSSKVVENLMDAKQKGESLPSLVELWIENTPQSLGQPIFKKIKSDLAQGFMSLGATCGVDFGSGFSAVKKQGTAFHKNSKSYGGLRGGLTTGERIVSQIVFKPPSSLKEVAQQGRHDPCIGPRAVPVVEAMACLVLADHLLWKRLDKI